MHWIYCVSEVCKNLLEYLHYYLWVKIKFFLFFSGITKKERYKKGEVDRYKF